MATSPADSWAPTFPDPGPAHWVAFAGRAGGCVVLSDQVLGPSERSQLAEWLTRHQPREPDAEASYVYLGLASGCWPLLPDGLTSPGGVTGVGSGVGLGEPEAATASTVASLVASAVIALNADENSATESK